MKKIGLITLLVVMVVFVMGAFKETRQKVFIPLRTSVASDDTALDGTTAGYTYSWPDKPADAVQMSIEDNNAEIIFYGTDAANEVSNFKIYAYRDKGPGRLVYSGTVTLGTALRSTGVYYGDTITGTDTWMTTVKITDSATNRVCSLSFDLCGHKYVQCEIDITTAATISAEISGF